MSLQKIAAVFTLSILASISVLAAAAELSSITPNDWLIIPGERVGAITKDSSEASLKAFYGEKNVQPGGFYIGEGICSPGSILFPNDPTKRLEIMWRHADTRTGVVSAQIFETPSVWHTASGITLGTTAEKVQLINGKPFKISGLGWDYGGYVVDWHKGNLFSDSNNVSIRFMEPEGMTLKSKFYGDGAFFESNQARKLLVSRISVDFPVAETDYEEAEQKDCSEYEAK